MGFPFDTGIKVDEVLDSLEYPTIFIKKYTVTGFVMTVRKKREVPLGKQVNVNGEEILIWRRGDQVYATSARCPHQGSHLLLGDIEDFGKGVSITCPAHLWQFSVDSGECLNHSEACDKLKTYPTMVDSERQIFVLFDSFSPALFNAQDF